VAIAAGYEHSVALESDGSVWAWGDNYYGELGLGAADPVSVAHSSPARVGSLEGVIAVAAGAYHTVVLDAAGGG
jgi:alpha-tubulin suppressor-like RCC1 family protein